MAFLFYVASISTPRSGGDYVFQARSSHPLVAFVNYWALWIAFALSLGLYSYLGAQWFAYLFSGLGLFYNDQALINLGSFLPQL
jgi:amino acid transporter